MSNKGNKKLICTFSYHIEKNGWKCLFLRHFFEKLFFLCSSKIWTLTFSISYTNNCRNTVRTERYSRKKGEHVSRFYGCTKCHFYIFLFNKKSITSTKNWDVYTWNNCAYYILNFEWHFQYTTKFFFCCIICLMPCSLLFSFFLISYI